MNKLTRTIVLNLVSLSTCVKCGDRCFDIEKELVARNALLFRGGILLDDTRSKSIHYIDTSGLRMEVPTDSNVIYDLQVFDDTVCCLTERYGTVFTLTKYKFQKDFNRLNSMSCAIGHVENFPLIVAGNRIMYQKEGGFHIHDVLVDTVVFRFPSNQLSLYSSIGRIRSDGRDSYAVFCKSPESFFNILLFTLQSFKVYNFQPVISPYARSERFSVFIDKAYAYFSDVVNDTTKVFGFNFLSDTAAMCVLEMKGKYTMYAVNNGRILLKDRHDWCIMEGP